MTTKLAFSILAVVTIVLLVPAFLAVGLVARNPFELALGLLLWMLAVCGALVVFVRAADSSDL